MAKRPVITLLTDFGTKDPYVACMKGVILRICPEAAIVDITHEIPKFDVRTGAFTLYQAVPYFPDGAIHVAVVDPGVGTARRGIVVKTERSVLVGPDNGLLILAARREGMLTAYEITNRKLMLPNPSHTFHGRDVFAPVAAHIACGVPPETVGPPVRELIEPSFVRPTFDGGVIRGEVIHVDGFGNVVSNIPGELLKQAGICFGDWVRVRSPGKEVRVRLCRTYGEVGVGIPLALVGSHGFLEVSINQGNAGKVFNFKVGDKVEVSRVG